jgi:hypothetical protein
MASFAVPLSTSPQEKLLHQLDCIERDVSEREQRLRDRFQIYQRPLIEPYLEGQVSVIFDLCLGADWNGDGQRFIDSAQRQSRNSLARLVFQHSSNYSRYAGQRKQEFVLVPDIQVVNGVEETIPSFAVWSEFVQNEEEKIRADGVYLHAPESMFQLVPANVNRETGLLAVSQSKSESGEKGVPAVVDSGLEVVYGITDYQRKIIERQGAIEIVMKKVITSLRIDFTRNVLSIWRTEIGDLPVYIRDMFIGPFDLESCCLERQHE